jgi:hypothetical protein
MTPPAGHADGSIPSATPGFDGSPMPPARAPGIRFTDVTAASGVMVTAARVRNNTSFLPLGVYMGNGVTAGDVDGDGLVDLVIGGGYRGPAVLYRNRGSLKFEQVAGADGGPLLGSAIGVALADLDNDGDPDLVLADAAGSIIYENSGGRLILRHNLAGVRTSGVLPADLDGDGLLEVFFYAQRNEEPGALPTQTMLRNRGDLEFEDVTIAWGLSAYGITWGAAAFDWDGDGALDVFLANDTGTADFGGGVSAPGNFVDVRDALFHNQIVDGRRRFSNVARQAQLDTARSSMGALVEDFDGDGTFDLFVSNLGRNHLLLAAGDGTYKDAGERFGLTEVLMEHPDCSVPRPPSGCVLSSWGAARFDADHDGFDDLVVVRGNVNSSHPDEAQAAGVWRGAADATYTKVDAGLGAMTARALLPVDLDGDGDLDLIVTQRGRPVRLFRNEAPPDRGWLRVRLEGKKSNRDGAGAVVTLTLASGRKIRRLAGAGGIVHSWAPVEAHFVTAGEAVTRLEILWPSGKRQEVAPVTTNRVLTVVEPS